MKVKSRCNVHVAQELRYLCLSCTGRHFLPAIFSQYQKISTVVVDAAR